MLDLPYSLMIEATQEPHYFSFYSPDLEGFTGSGQSIEDCLSQARLGMKEHVELLRQQGLGSLLRRVPEDLKLPRIEPIECQQPQGQRPVSAARRTDGYTQIRAFLEQIVCGTAAKDPDHLVEHSSE